MTSGVSFLETYEQHRYKRQTNAGDIPSKVNGINYCKFCGTKVPLDISLRYYCKKTCREEMNIRAGFFRYKVLKRDGYRCVKCREKAREVDHIIPVIEGGGSCGLDNLRTLCKSCHRKETNKLMARRRKPKADELEFF